MQNPLAPKTGGPGRQPASQFEAEPWAAARRHVRLRLSHVSPAPPDGLGLCMTGRSGNAAKTSPAATTLALTPPKDKP